VPGDNNTPPSASGEANASETDPPSVTLSNLAAAYKPASVIDVALTAVDVSPLRSLRYGLEENGVAPTSFNALSVDATQFSITLPAEDRARVRVQLVAVDNHDNRRDAFSTAFRVDGTPPAARPVALASEADTREPTVQLTVSDCSDVAFVAVNESVAPDATDSGWLPCTTVAGALSHTLVGEGAHLINVWLKDDVGNVATIESASHLVTLDTTAPDVSLTAYRGGEYVLAGAVLNVSYSASDSHFAATPVSIEASQDGGVSWEVVAGCSSLPASGTCTYTAPNADVTGLRFRVSAADLAGNVATDASAANVGVDLSAPVFAAGQFNLDSNRASTVRTFVTAAMLATDAVSPITRFCLKAFDVAAAPVTPSPPA
jgi:hypothetical protein